MDERDKKKCGCTFGGSQVLESREWATRKGLDTSVAFNIDVLLARPWFCVVIEATSICIKQTPTW